MSRSGAAYGSRLFDARRDSAVDKALLGPALPECAGHLSLSRYAPGAPTQDGTRTGWATDGRRAPLVLICSHQVDWRWRLQWPHGWRLTCAKYHVTLNAPLRQDACLCAPAPQRQPGKMVIRASKANACRSSARCSSIPTPCGSAPMSSGTMVVRKSLNDAVEPLCGIELVSLTCQSAGSSLVIQRASGPSALTSRRIKTKLVSASSWTSSSAGPLR